MFDCVAHLVFSMGPWRCALATSDIEEVVVLPNIARIPGTPPHILGLARYRDDVVPVVDVVRVLQGRTEAWSRSIVVSALGQRAALTASQVWGVAEVACSEPLGTSEAAAWLQGPAQSDRGEVWLLDPQVLFRTLLSSDPGGRS